jgi:hypothetical protein
VDGRGSPFDTDEYDKCGGSSGGAINYLSDFFRLVLLILLVSRYYS